MTDVQHVRIPYSPRKLQQAIHDLPERFRVVVCHRRFGKTVLGINDLQRDVLTCDLPMPRAYYVCPLHKQAKAVAWDYAKHFADPIPGRVFNEAELRIDYPNGGRLQLLGADNADGLRGLYADSVCMDEVSQMAPSVWTKIFRPALADRKGRAMFIGTPQGVNEFKRLYDRAESLDGWARVLHRASETGLLDAVELLSASREMSEDEYMQEFECSWSAAVRGAYYSKQIEASERDGRICDVPWEPDHPVLTAWDLGLDDAMTVWFFQVIGGRHRFIESLSWTDTSLADVIREVKAKEYIYDRHWAPHDIEVRDLGSGIKRIDFARTLGIGFSVTPKIPVADGINAARLLIQSASFDSKKCADGLEALRHYRKEWDDKNQRYRNTPLHDWASDYADGFRMAAVAQKRSRRQNQTQAKRVSAAF